MKRLALFLAVLLCFAPSANHAAEIKITTWNLNWLTLRAQGDQALPADVRVRAPDDFTRLRDYANKLHSDVIAFQEIDGAAAAALVFDPARYDIFTIGETVVQRVGLAVRHGLKLVPNPDYQALDVEPSAKYRLRDGMDATLILPGGNTLRMLVVHLKTGCQYERLARSRRPQCTLLAQQIAPLAAWVAARRSEGMPFLVLGDFNRVFDFKEELSTALAQAAPMLRVTEGASDPCWDGGPFIDHIFAGGPARKWIVPDSLRVQVFHEFGEDWKDRLSDHCPVSVKLRVGD
jgi:endonuclease/exonuclease/phosphatase family metal-dependent hydrolase